MDSSLRLGFLYLELKTTKSLSFRLYHHLKVSTAPAGDSLGITGGLCQGMQHRGPSSNTQKLKKFTRFCCTRILFEACTRDSISLLKTCWTIFPTP